MLAPGQYDLVNGRDADGVELNLAVFIGSDYEFFVQITSDEETIAGQEFTGKIVNAANTVIATFAVTIANATTKIIKLQLAKAITIELTPGMGRWDVFRSDIGNSTPLLFGRCEIYRSPSNA